MKILLAVEDSAYSKEALRSTKILENASKWGADLIVMGSHGWKGVNRFLLGSVSEAVARHAACSVEIVRMHQAQSGQTPVSAS